MVKRSSANQCAPGDVAIEYLELRDQVGRLRGEIGSPLGGRLLASLNTATVWRVQVAEQRNPSSVRPSCVSAGVAPVSVSS